MMPLGTWALYQKIGTVLESILVNPNLKLFL